MIGRNKLDEVWLGAGPGDRLMTICNCCPCCCIWKMLPDLNPQIGAKISKLPDIRVMVTDECRGCKACCEDICFVGAIIFVADNACITAACRGCGRCVEVCPNDAIEILIEDEEFIQSTIDRMSKLIRF